MTLRDSVSSTIPLEIVREYLEGWRQGDGGLGLCIFWCERRVVYVYFGGTGT